MPAARAARRAVLYCRLSESDDASTSIARQEADLRARADREGWDVVAVLQDDGLSGGVARAKADRALAMLREGEADVLSVWKLDRWSRQGISAVADLIDVLDAWPSALFVADRDGLSSDQPAWRIIASVLAEVARMERENTQTRVRSSVAALRKSGRYSGGNLPYGYRAEASPNGPGRVLVVDANEAAIVREMATRVLAGESLYAVMGDLNHRSVPTRRGKRWSVQSIRQLLASDAIVGRVVHRTDVLRGNDGLPVQMWPPVLDPETWTRLRGRLGADGPGRAAPPRRRARLLSGIATCGTCGSPLYVRESGSGVAAYACSAKSNGVPCTASVSVSAELLEEYVTATFLDAVGALEVMERVESVPEDDAALADVDRALKDTAASMTSDDADVPALAARLATLKDRRADLRSRPTERDVRLVGTGETFTATWGSADLAARQTILRANVALLSIGKGTRGRRGLDPARVTLIAQPSHVAENNPADHTAGRVVQG